MSWNNPIPSYNLITTNDSDSFKNLPQGTTGIPTFPHCGSFGIVRKFDVHQGIDLYCKEFTKVYPVEEGIVIDVGVFTGEKVGMPWWNETYFVSVQGKSGIVIYGEIVPYVCVGDSIHNRTILGNAIPVLKKDKGRPMCMLHLELIQQGVHVDPATYLTDNTSQLEV